MMNYDPVSKGLLIEVTSQLLSKHQNMIHQCEVLSKDAERWNAAMIIYYENVLYQLKQGGNNNDTK